MRWAVIVGRSATGREAALDAVVGALRAQDLRVGGVRQGSVKGEGIWAEDLAGQGRLMLARTSTVAPDLCEWAFEPGAFQICAGWIAAAPFDVVILPAGRLEATGRGHWPAIEAAFASAQLVVLCIPPSVLPRIALDLPDPVAGVELPIDPAALERLAGDLAAAAGARSGPIDR